MRIPPLRFGVSAFLLWTLIVSAGAAGGQNPPASHVIIPNPTPRPPDLKQEFGENAKDQKKSEVVSIQNQLRAREIWLESNQILFLAQQLKQDILSGNKSISMTTSAARAGQIEKLAQGVQQNMKVH